MAVSTKKMDFSNSLKQRLEFLGCSHIEGMDETAVADLLLNPGEGRLKILQWLLSRYDQRLEEFLNSSQSLGYRTESRLQRLLTAANAMCLCRYDDVDLIRGNGSLSRQMTFIDRLLDLVCIRQASLDSSTRPSSVQGNQYVDALVSQEGFLDMFDSSVNLVPRDIRQEVDKMWIKKGWDTDSRPPGPNLQDLTTRSESLAAELQKQNSVLATLQQQISLQGEGKNAELMTMIQTLATVLRELRQLADGFTRCYESNISQWCHKTPPELSDLGTVFKRVHGSLQKFVKLFEDLNRIRQIQTKLSKSTRKEADIRPQVLEQASKEASESFQRCLTVLEETLHRTDSNFISQHAPVLHI